MVLATNINVEIIDGFYYLHFDRIYDASYNRKNLSLHSLSANEIHLILIIWSFYSAPWIKLKILKFDSELHEQKKSIDLNYINCTGFASKLGSDLCLGLPDIHGYSGSDCTVAFFNKGKVTLQAIFEEPKLSKLMKLTIFLTKRWVEFKKSPWPCRVPKTATK